MAASHLRWAFLVAAAGVGAWYLVHQIIAYLGADELRHRLQELEVELENIRKNRRADRAGRQRAEAALRQLQTELSAAQAAAAAAGQPDAASQQESSDAAANGAQPLHPAVYPFRPIGTLLSCFTTRNGTPRQPLLVPAARAVLQLAPGVPPACLEGLEQYSHCWVLYVFHANTDMGKVLPLDDRRAVIKPKISVPRLNGAKMGVLATRSPHRPVPIGLSVARVLEVGKGRLVLGGADIVNGSPVLDIKPYVPFCDAVPGATAPGWVQAEATHEPLHISEVAISDEAAEAIASSWHAIASAHHTASTSSSASSAVDGSSACRTKSSRSRGGKRSSGGSLYATAEEFVDLVRQVLSRDIRSLHQRLREFTAQTRYHVVLEGVNIQYEIEEATGRVTVVGAGVDAGDSLMEGQEPLQDDEQEHAAGAGAGAGSVARASVSQPQRPLVAEALGSGSGDATVDTDSGDATADEGSADATADKRSGQAQPTAPQTHEPQQEAPHERSEGSGATAPEMLQPPELLANESPAEDTLASSECGTGSSSTASSTTQLTAGEAEEHSQAAADAVAVADPSSSKSQPGQPAEGVAAEPLHGAAVEEDEQSAQPALLADEQAGEAAVHTATGLPAAAETASEPAQAVDTAAPEQAAPSDVSGRPAAGLASQSADNSTGPLAPMPASPDVVPGVEEVHSSQGATKARLRALLLEGPELATELQTPRTPNEGSSIRPQTPAAG